MPSSSGESGSLRAALRSAALILLGVLPLCGAAAGCRQASGRIQNAEGMYHYRQGNLAAAREAFRRAAIDDPESPDYAFNLASASRRQGQHSEAEQFFRQALYLDPTHQPSYHGLAEMLKEQGRTDEAVALLDGWTQIDALAAGPYVELAWLQREMGDPAASQASLQAALQRRPDHPIALAQLGRLHEESGAYDQAVSMYRRSLQARWNQPQVRSRLTTLTRPQPAFASNPLGPQTAFGAAPGRPVSRTTWGWGTPDPQQLAAWGAPHGLFQPVPTVATEPLPTFAGAPPHRHDHAHPGDHHHPLTAGPAPRVAEAPVPNADPAHADVPQTAHP